MRQWEKGKRKRQALELTLRNVAGKGSKEKTQPGGRMWDPGGFLGIAVLWLPSLRWELARRVYTIEGEMNDRRGA